MKITVIEKCPNCGAEVLVQTVRCALCGAQVRDFVMAPEGSRFAGLPICGSCIDAIPNRRKVVGPSETKGE